MRKTIKGRRYDTDAAQELAENFYRKKNGEYFLVVDGEITVMRYNAARDWAADHLTPEKYLEYFNETDDDRLTPLHLVLPLREVRKIKNAALTHRLSAAEYVRRLCDYEATHKIDID